MDWNEIIMAVFTAVVIPLLGLLVKYLYKKLDLQVAQFKGRMDQEWRYAIEQAASLAVTAAEQSGIAGLLEGVYSDKKAYACEWAERYLAQYGIVVDLDVLAGLIEAEVLNQFPKAE